MQRPIKFRAWHPSEKKMIPYEDFLLYDYGVEPVSFVMSLRGEPYNYQYMQYTGLKDKNGTEIYEGDILLVDWNDKRYPIHTIGPVKWDERKACWHLGEGGTAKDDAESYMEVIGNIYENSELLETK